MRWYARAGCLTGVGSGPIRESQNTQPSELRFRARLGKDPEVELAIV